MKKISDYVIALTHLYGVVHKDKVVEIYNMQNENQVDGIDLYEMKADTQSIDPDELVKNFVRIYQDYFVHETIWEFDEFESILEKKARKPYYIPKQEELLRYKDDLYFEVTKEYEKLIHYMTEHLYKDDAVYAENLVEDIQGFCQMATSPSSILSYLDERGVKFKDEQEFHTLFQLIVDLANNTRIWENNGHTPNELFRLYENSNLGVLPKKPYNPRKIGRNDPCPCGSGKKYKKCCM